VSQHESIVVDVSAVAAILFAEPTLRPPLPVAA
jgi:hypothetical protein